MDLPISVVLTASACIAALAVVATSTIEDAILYGGLATVFAISVGLITGLLAFVVEGTYGGKSFVPLISCVAPAIATAILNSIVLVLRSHSRKLRRANQSFERGR